MVKLNDLFEKTMEGMSNMISPDSMAFNGENQKQFTIKEFMRSEELKKLIQPGDIVLTKTSSSVYGLVRKLMDSEYDHVSVFLDSQSVLHISPPRVRIIPSNIFLMSKMEPFIIRPMMTPAERDAFIIRLRSFENQSYDYKGLFQIFGLKTLHNLFNYSSSSNYLLYNLNQANSKKRKICTDLIIFSLAQSCGRFMDVLKRNISKLNFSFVGAFSPDDLKFLSEKEKKIFSLVYPREEDLKRIREESLLKDSKNARHQNEEWVDEVKIETSDFLLERQSLPTTANLDALIYQVTRLLTLAQANKIFTKGYLNKLKERIGQVALFQHARFVYNLWILKNFLTKRKTILQNKTKFIITVYQVYKSLSAYDLIHIHFEKIYIPLLQYTLKKIASFLFPFLIQSPKL